MDHFCCYNKRLKKIVFLILLIPSLIFAQEEIESTMSIGDLAKILYQWIVKIAGICALLMIVWGGAEYAFFSSANPAKVEEAKEKIKSAIYGLLIVLLSWLLLYIINPEFVT